MQVIDVNDEAPVFQRAEFEAQVMENQGPGTTVLRVSAVDRDQGGFTCVHDESSKPPNVPSCDLSCTNGLFCLVCGAVQALTAT